MYRTLSDRQSGNMYGRPLFSLISVIICAAFTHTHCRLDFWETSRDETTGEIRFRRQTQFVNRGDSQDGASGDVASSTALPMGRLVRTQQPPVEERYVERFEARDIELDDDSESDKKRSINTEGIEYDKLEPGWAHAK